MLVGKDIGPYSIDKELGAGAMGTVFRGRHRETGQVVAIKIVAPGLAANDAAMTRFKREISILKQLEHPNIVKLFQSGKYKNTPFYVMEYVEGESLDHVMERRGRITWEDLVPLGQQLCAGLQHAHDKGIIHRDLKPSNLMILKDGTVKLTDFGIAKDTDVTALTAANSTVGTASYMSPEQCKGTKDLTHKSDLYSMGVMFFELLTGRKPFYAESVMDMFQQHMTGTFERPSRMILEIPIWLDTLICQLLEKEPDKRPFNAAMVSESLGMVQEKVEAQQSAGIDAVKKRRVDRTSTDRGLDETDRDIARTLLGKKKKKPKPVAFYQQGWFTLLALGVLLAGFGFLAYTIFFKVPSAESYITLAQTQLAKSDFTERKEGRAAIDEFFRYYKDHPRAADMQKLADQYDVGETESQMHNRRNAKFRVDGIAEDMAREALDNEDLGKLDKAAERWEQLAKYEKKKEPEERAWGLVAKKYRDELRGVQRSYNDLQSKVAEEQATGKKVLGDTKEERIALEAVRKDNTAQAANIWNDLKALTRDEPSQRRWYLLAAWKQREISDLQK